jgi:hypothetical protein
MLTLPPAVVSLLAGPVPHPYHEFRVEREALVRRQADLIASSPSYSGLSFAGSFLQR